MASLPKFESRLKSKIAQPGIDQLASGGYGIVVSYNSQDNTASVLLSNRGSDDPGQIYNNVPCPTTVGVQSTAPEPGRPCCISFKDSSHVYPIITNFFNHAYANIDLQRQSTAVNAVPRFMFQA